MDDLKRYLIESVLRHESDSLLPATETVLSNIRREKSDIPVIYVSSLTSSIIAGSDKTWSAIKNYFAGDTEYELVKAGYLGPSTYEPMICVQLPGRNRIFFRNITDDKVETLLDGVFHNDVSKDDLVGQDGTSGFCMWQGIPFMRETSFFKHQRRVVLPDSGCFNPESIEEYISRGGYRTFLKIIKNYSSSDVCNIVEKSGLRGRSGGGYSTGLKWKQALNAHSDTYMICNAKESDPGSYKDRTLLESDPHKLIEGLAIAAYAIGSHNAIIFFRRDSDHVLSMLQNAIKMAYDYGLLGKNIFSTSYSLDITIRRDPGAFVCGEETALINSLEGKRGMPQLKPPYPVTSGLFGKPTVINNVETLMNVSAIMQNGPEWFRGIGTEGSPGTKVFFLSGKGCLSGIIEVEMGSPLRMIVEDIAEGIKEGKEFKAIQLGGALGSFLTAKDLDTLVDYESIKELKIGMGAGSLMIIDETICMVDLIRYFMEFIRHEGCGKCIPCREGTGRMLEILESVIRKPASDDSMSTLERFKGVMQLETIASVMKDTSRCGLGQMSASPFLSALRNFREEFEEHIFDRKCRANVCRGLRTFSIDVERCTGCTACASKCPVNAIYGTKLQPFFIVEEKCTGCGICFDICKFSAIKVK